MRGTTSTNLKERLWMDNLISRKAAIETMSESLKRVFPEHRQIAEKCLNALPPAQPTLYGYNIEHFKLIAEVLRKENLSPERVAEALTDVGRIVSIMDKDQENRGGVMKDNKAIRMYDHIRSSVDVDPWAMDILQEVLEAYLADGCQGCIYEDVNEWEMPCKKCKRNCKDYWRSETHHG